MKECPNPSCRTQNRDDAAYCINCGRELADVVPVTTTGGRSGGARSLSAGSRLDGGRYVIKDVLGEGGMGAALLATDNRVDNKLVVIKELISDNTDPARLQEDIRNFKQEVATLAHIDHPLIPNVTDYFEEKWGGESRHFMVQEYVEGETLEKRIDRTKQPMKEREVLGYASEVLDVLDYLEQQTPPIVHRDIKPANIIIGVKDKRAHLVDFGIARADVARNVKRKQTSALGTPGYAPPEQYQGNADPRSDLYALAATLHHLLTNRDPRNHPPFAYPPVRALNPQLSPEIERVLSRALTNDINHRYQSAAQMKQDVDEILLKRFGVSGNISSYVLGTSGPIKAANVPLTSTASAPTVAGQPGIANQPTLTQQQPPPPLPRTINPPTPPPPGWQGTPYQPVSTYTGRPPVPPPPRKSHVGRNFLLFILVILLIVGAAYAGLTYIRSRSSVSNTPTPTIPQTGIGAMKVANGEYIGVSDGTVAFDVDRASGSLKRQAADSLKNGDVTGAQSLWDQAKQQDTNDAETLIYLEDQRVIASGRPYITIVVGTMLTGTDSSVGRSDLQGAYVAQKEFNDGFKLPNGIQVRLLVANSGSNKAYATTVAQQIVQLAKNDKKTFVGVMGWPFSSRALNVVNILAKAQIPMVSQTASSDLLTGISRYFFRVSPSNKTEAVAGAKYAEQILRTKNAALFADPTDPYSENLANDFKRQFEADGNKVVVTETYTIGKPEKLPGLLTDALTRNPDLIYFAGYPGELKALIAQLPPCNASNCVKVLGGDALYQLKSYPSAGYPSASYNRLYFTAFAYPDMWNDPNLAPQKPANFFNDYSQDFDPNGKFPPNSKYGYNRADGDTMLSYDAMLALLKGYSIASDNGKKQTVTPNDLRQALTKITGAQALQGVSGRIEFDARGDSVDKVVVILRVDSGGFTQIDRLLGRILK